MRLTAKQDRIGAMLLLGAVLLVLAGTIFLLDGVPTVPIMAASLAFLAFLGAGVLARLPNPRFERDMLKSGNDYRGDTSESDG